MSTDTDFAGEAFPSTRWSQLCSNPSGTDGALDALAQRYWRPVAAYVRARWARTDDDARDATQEFFLWVQESRLLERADPERGHFRGFIKTALANFVHDLERKRRTLKRGGGHGFEALGLELQGTGEKSPDEVLDDTWRAELIEQATQALERELAASGKPTYFAVFRDYFLSQDDQLDYAATAARHGISRVDVSNYLTYAKQRYRQQLRRAVLDTVHGDEELRAELTWLFGEERG